MCVIIDWNGDHIDTQAGLCRKVPIRPLPLREGYSEKARREGGCLCPIDIEDVLDACGVQWEKRSGIPDYVVETGGGDEIDYMEETEPDDRREVHQWARNAAEQRLGGDGV